MMDDDIKGWGIIEGIKWYTSCHGEPKSDLVIEVKYKKYFGYLDEPPYKVIEKHDLRRAKIVMNIT